MSEIYLGTPPPGVVSWCEKKYSKRYLTIEFLTPGYCLIRNTTNYIPLTKFKYSYDGKTWFDSALLIGMNDAPTQVIFDEPHSDYAFNQGDKLFIKDISFWSNDIQKTYFDIWGYVNDEVIGNAFKIYGSLYESCTNEFRNSAIQYKFAEMFKSTNNIGALSDAKDLQLDVPVLNSQYAYSNFFNGQKSLINASVNPSGTTLSENCFNDMFIGCDNIQYIHYSKSFADNSEFLNMKDAPRFGAPSSCNVIYDL